MSTEINFLYLSEPEMIEAGVTNMHRCVEVMEETFQLLGQGDYVMGGGNGNSHGAELLFPKESIFPNMPLAGPDRRFLSLIAYLGGRFKVCGMKWYGSNVENRAHGLPRSILTVMLNDAVSGAPLALMSGNLLSGFRTGAVPGVAAKYLAVKDTKTIGMVGAGVMSKTSLTAFLDVLKNVEEIKIYDVFPQAAEKLCKYAEETFGKKARAVYSVETAVRDSDVVSMATSGPETPELQEEWLKEGALVCLPAGVKADKNLVKKTKLVADNWKMFEAWETELAGTEASLSEHLGEVAAFGLELVNERLWEKDHVINLGDIVSGKRAGRVSDKEKIFFILGGMAVEDVAWGYELYQNALKLGLGTKLNLWETPYVY